MSLQFPLHLKLVLDLGEYGYSLPASKFTRYILLYLHFNLKELGPGLAGGARSAPIRESINKI